MKIAIVGYDIEGKASYDYFRAQGGHELTVCDQKADISVPDGAASVLGDTYLDDLDRFDVIVRTAGLPPRLILEKNPNVADKITSQVNEFLKVSPTRQIIGVTGTKGKGTTSTLIAKMLEAAGKTVKLGGNIGLPPLGFVTELKAGDWVVLELSSFQLIDVQASPHIGVCLMVVSEHLNWHDGFGEYVAAKANLFNHQTTDDLAIYFADNAQSKQIAEHSAGQRIPFFALPGAIISDGSIVIADQFICQTSELKLLGEHNWQNACAAVTAVWHASADTQNLEAMRSVLTTFSGLEHRLEFVRELDGVCYYDDSFGTTPETAIVALQAFAQPKVVILGGSDKGASYDELAQVVANTNVRSAVLIGNQAGRIQTALDHAGFTATVEGGRTMSEIVEVAQQVAQAGDVVLLSPACASYDLFKNYKERGDQFKAAVQALASAV